MEKTEIDLAEARTSARFYAPITVVLWIAAAFAWLENWMVTTVLLFMGAVALSGAVLFHGATVAISRLPDRSRNVAQVFIVAVFVAFLASYFMSGGIPTIETVDEFLGLGSVAV